MKKLITLVLALALVFAIAAPAMAAGMGFDKPTDTTTTPTYSNITLTVTQLNVTAATGMTGYYAGTAGTYYALYNTNIGVVEGTPVRFAIDYSFPKTGEINGYNATDFANLLLTLEFANLKDVAITPTGTEVKANEKYTDAVASLSTTAATTKSFMVTANVAASGKPATIKATLTGGQAGPNVTFTKNSKNYSATVSTNDVLVANTASGAVVTFHRVGAGTDAATSKIIGLSVDPDGSGTLGVATVGVDAGVATFTVSGARLDATAAAPYLAALNEIFGVLGFSWSPTFELGYFSAANVLGLAAKLSVPATATYKAFTANLTVTDGTSVPNTGDNMSVIGFVMVGLALLATAAVVVKKVRA